MSHESIKVKISLNKPGVADRLVSILKKYPGIDLTNDSQGNGPDLLILELGSNPEEDFARITDLLKQGKAREIFLVSNDMAPAVLMQAMRAGVKEIFPLPLDANDVFQALERFKARNPEDSYGKSRPETGKIISIVGSKGGVGATTVAVNLAVTWSESKRKPSVALLDMNTMLGEVPLFLEITPKFHWGEITKNIDRLDKEFLLKVMTRHESGVHVLPSPSSLNGHHSPTPDIIQRLLDEMKRTFDVVVIDAGQPMKDVSLKTLQLSDEVLLVSILSLPCLSNTVRMMRSYVDYSYVNREHINVILNRVMKKMEISIQDAEESFGKSILFSLPNDYNTSMTAINSGKPLSHVSPKSELARSFMALADKLIPTEDNSKQIKTKSWSLFNRLARKDAKRGLVTGDHSFGFPATPDASTSY